MNDDTRDGLVSVVAYLFGSAALVEEEASSITSLHFVAAGLKILNLLAHQAGDQVAAASLDTIREDMQQVLADPVAMSACLRRLAREFAEEVVRRHGAEVGPGPST